MKIFLPLLVVFGLVLTGCVSNKSVQTIQLGDERLSCTALKTELAQLGVIFEETKDDSGVTGKNVGLAIVFWPGIIVNEVRANKNQDSIDARISHLSSIYNKKCLEDEAQITSSDLTSRLEELDGLLGKGLISEEEHEILRKKAIQNL